VKIVNKANSDDRSAVDSTVVVPTHGCSCEKGDEAPVAAKKRVNYDAS
jgi:hypothetical protein